VPVSAFPHEQRHNLATLKYKVHAGFDIKTFTLFWVLKRAGTREADQVAPNGESAFRKYPNYRVDIAEERQLKADMYQLILAAAGKDAIVPIANSDLADTVGVAYFSSIPADGRIIGHCLVLHCLVFEAKGLRSSPYATKLGLLQPSVKKPKLNRFDRLLLGLGLV
jgi:hypothetical protein